MITLYILRNTDSVPYNLSAERVDSSYWSWQMQEFLCFTHDILYIEILVKQAMKFSD